MDFINSGNSILMIWLVIFIFSIVVELATTHLVSVWFSAGALIAMICNALGLSEPIQITLFIIVSVICIVISRPLAKKYLRTNIVSTNLDRVIGQHGLVTKTMTADFKGEVKVMSTSWMAIGINNETIKKGEYCEILAVEGAHLVVKKTER